MATVPWSRATGCKMANHPYRSKVHRQIAEDAGYFVQEGTQEHGAENRVGRWYLGRQGEPFTAKGQSYPSPAQAWFAAANAALAVNTSALVDQKE